MAPVASARYVALAGLVALITGGCLILARLLKLGFLADFLSQTVLVGFLTGVGFQVAIAVLGEMLGIETHSKRTIGATGRSDQRPAWSEPRGLRPFRDGDCVHSCSPTAFAHVARPFDRSCGLDGGEFHVRFRRARYSRDWSSRWRTPDPGSARRELDGCSGSRNKC